MEYREENVSTRLDGKYLVFKFNGGHEYDPSIETTEDPTWLSHMRDKTWFTKRVEDNALRLLGKTESDWENSTPRWA